MGERKSDFFSMRTLRRVVQILSLAAFVYLFLLTVGQYDPAAKRIALLSRAPVDTYFRIDPLAGLTVMLSIRRIVPVMLFYALPIVILTVFAGRFLCGWICPLGVCLDIADKIFFRGSRRQRRGGGVGQNRLRSLKYYILIAVLTASLLGGQLVYLLDPITLITRAFTFALFPIAQLGLRWVGGQDLIEQRLASAAGSPLFPRDVQYFFRLNLVAAAVFIGVIALNSITRRYWCRNLCPLGALLAVFSKASVVRRQVGGKCNNCAKCVSDCKMGAIYNNPRDYQATECIYCYDCTRVCPVLATRIAPALRSEGYKSSLDLRRRHALQAFGIGAAFAVLARTNAAAKTSRTGGVKTSSEFLIRPPGAVPEDEFVNRCIRCSECMKVCPTGGLQPAITEAGIAGLWTPVLVPKLGECTQNCNLCSQVCSSQAIQPFEISEKPYIYIGRAVIDRSQCIAWNSDRKCLVCDEHCSYHAVYWKEVDGVKRPFVNEYRCVGCGICENACPIQPHSAIRVYSFGDRRSWTREQQKAFYELGAKSAEPGR
ncbi:MAG: 4Fe-4S binding protein [Armatimonadota bacterium]|nr:4Fe-4S binding protein [Armatimonadota bacterium]